MQYYAIRHRATGRYIYGTDFTNPGRPRQILSSPLRPPRLFTGAELAVELKVRHINSKFYKVEVVEIRKAVL